MHKAFAYNTYFQGFFSIFSPVRKSRLDVTNISGNFTYTLKMPSEFIGWVCMCACISGLWRDAAQM